jgi:hypothetical protein
MTLWKKILGTLNQALIRRRHRDPRIPDCAAPVGTNHVILSHSGDASPPPIPETSRRDGATKAAQDYNKSWRRAADYAVEHGHPGLASLSWDYLTMGCQERNDGGGICGLPPVADRAGFGRVCWRHEFAGKTNETVPNYRGVHGEPHHSPFDDRLPSTLNVMNANKRDHACIWFSHLPTELSRELDWLVPEQSVKLLINGHPTTWARMKPGDGRPTRGIRLEYGKEVWPR